MLPVTPLFIADIYFYQDEDTNDTDGSKFNMSKMMYLLCKNLALLSKFWRNRRSNWPSNVAFAMFLSPQRQVLRKYSRLGNAKKCNRRMLCFSRIQN